MTSASVRDLGTLGRRSFASIAVKGGQGALAFLAAFMAARWLGADEYGRYVIALSVLNVAAVIGPLGLPYLLLRHVAVYEQQGAWGLRRGLRRRSLQHAAAVTVLTMALGAGVALAGRAGMVPFGDPWPIAVALCLTGPLVLLRLLGSWLLGRQRVVAGQLGEAVLRHLFFLLLLAAAAALGLASGSLAAMLLQALAVAAALAIVAVVFVRDERALPAHAPVFETRGWILAALPLMGTAILHAALYNVDILMLGALRDPASAGIYHAAARVAQFAALAQVAVNAVLGPSFARLIAAEETARLQRIAVTAARALTGLALALLALLAMVGAQVLGLFGPGFEAGYPVLMILLAAQTVNVAAGAVGLLLNMAGLERVTLAGVGAGALANVVLNAALIPPFGVTGAAVATGAGLVLWNLILCAAVIRRLGINPTAFGRAALGGAK